MHAYNFTSIIRSFQRDRHKWIIVGSLLSILALGALLRFYQLGNSGVGNAYYAAAVKSMLRSWRNFFFVAFEPGGSVSLDKPPLGFWIEAVSAYFLGVNGFALALPNAIAGVLSILLIYLLICRPFGALAGLSAALTLAVMPVAIATERNNTIDGMLVFVLLLAAWAFLQFVYSGKARWLFLGAFIVGLGFNIKMLQAYMPLPAFYAIYFFGAKHKWPRKILHLAIATMLLLVVSFSWVVAVDLTPTADRPYMDSTSGNSVMELIFGHNGIERLANSRGVGSNPGGNSSLGETSNGTTPPSSGGEIFTQGNPPQLSNGQPFEPPPSGNNGGFVQMINGEQQGGRPGGSMDFGSAGSLRLFIEPLSGEASWLLPFVLGGLLVIALAFWKQPFGEGQLSVILWAGWLLPETIYFTYSQGLMHAYYLIMIGAPIAALAAITT
jgi:4-amino-4-deoxy-L-arabinose transferase-like glycosyltransferase